jgi:hypothetical protein
VELTATSTATMPCGELRTSFKSSLNLFSVAAAILVWVVVKNSESLDTNYLEDVVGRVSAIRWIVVVNINIGAARL